MSNLKLTDEQIEAAAKAMYESTPCGIQWESLPKHEWIHAARAAAPFLQAPWDMPSSDEHMAFIRDTNETQIPGGVRFNFSGALKLFISRRNASLLPKPVDPRREKIAAEVQKIKDEARSGPIDYVNPTPSEIADRIITALDELEAAHV